MTALSGLTTVWAMRHGETEWNVRSLVQGHGDSPLTPRGERESRDAAELLRGEGIARVLSSDLGRARATAAIVAGALGLEVETEPLWRELDVGSEVEGLATSAIAALPGYVRAPSWRFPGGESLLTMRDRVLGALAALGAAATAPFVPAATLVVTHAGPLRVLLAEARRLPLLEVKIPRGFVGRFAIASGRIEAAVAIRGDPVGGTPPGDP